MGLDSLDVCLGVDSWPLVCSEATLQLGELTWGQGDGSYCHFHVHKIGETVLPRVQNQAKKSDIKLMSLTYFRSIYDYQPLGYFDPTWKYVQKDQRVIILTQVDFTLKKTAD